MRRLLLAVLVITGCHRASQLPMGDADALWSLAPEGARIGVVATPRALAMLEHGWQDLHAFVANAPELAPLAQQLDSRLQALTGASGLKLADLGLTADKGAAYFGTGPHDGVVIVPLADRDTFLAKLHGTKGSAADTIEHGVCKTVKGVYACASSEAVLATLGKGTLRHHLDTRGDIELVAAGVGGMPMKSVAVSAHLERGAVTLRGTLDGLPTAVTSKLGGPLRAQIDRDHTAGFGVIDLGALLATIPDQPIGAGVTSAALARSLVGGMYVSVSAGAPSLDVRIPLKDPVPAQTLIDKCGDLLPVQLTALTQGGTCHIPPSVIGVGLDAWVDGNTLRIGMKDQPTPVAVPLGHAGTELADRAWTFAFWGRGSVLAVPPLHLPPFAIGDPNVQLMVRAALMVNEMGFAARVEGEKVTAVVTVRTAFCNPDDVVAKLATMSPADVVAGKGVELAGSAATAAVPLADDIKAGATGLVVPLLFNLFAVNVVLGMTQEREAPPTAPP
jgi:hypothetical protein